MEIRMIPCLNAASYDIMQRWSAAKSPRYVTSRYVNYWNAIYIRNKIEFKKF